MGTGWRKAFCTTIPRNTSEVQNDQKTSGKLGFFKSNPSTPRFHSTSNASTPRLNNNDNCNDSVIDNLNITPRLRCKTNNKSTKSSLFALNPASPRSPFSILKASLGLSRSNCGVCFQSVKTGQKTAIFTAECSHTFHFPCILKHVKQENTLICPICKSTWKDASFLSINNLKSNQIHQTNENLRSNSTNSTNSQHFVKSRSKAFDDDEPLQTPRCNIIQTPKQDVNVDDEEFKGFFVNPVLSSSSNELQHKVEVMLMPEVAIISSTQLYDTYAVILNVKAPSLNNSSRAARAPIDLVVVLDSSASMAGAKIQMLKRAMRLVISSLGSSDRLSVVAFSGTPKRLLAFRKMSPKGQRSARRVIDQLACSRGSCAGEALKVATKVLEDRRERNPVASIILLSDGHQEHLTDNKNSNSNNNYSRQSSGHTRFAHVEIPVHTLEKTGTGRGSYTRDPEENAFTKCVGGLLSVVAQDLRVELGVAVGSDPAEITAVYSCNGKPAVLNAGSIQFGDLYAEEEREVLVELRVPKSKSKSKPNTGHSHIVLSGRCCYMDPGTQEVIYSGEKALLVPRVPTIGSPKIQRLRNLFIATRAVAESRLLVEYNKLTTARSLLSSARDLLMQSTSGEEFVRGLESELVDVEWRVQYQRQAFENVKF